MALVAAATVLASALAFAALPASPAAAAHPTKYCPNTTNCEVRSPGYGGGTLSVDVDAIFGPNNLISWWLVDVNTGWSYCQTDYWVNDPARSWTCGLPAGTYELQTGDISATHDFSIGLRY
jgi:hypothetical protein